jgi:hypothetical protein
MATTEDARQLSTFLARPPTDHARTLRPEGVRGERGNLTGRRRGNRQPAKRR